MGADTGSTTPADQQYQLRWNDFHSSILSSFRHLRDEEDFVDVTLACQGCSFKAHKVVLSACSPYFRELLKANPCKHPIIILRDVPKKDMENLLRFMYNGEVNVAHENLTDFIKTAQMLQVRGLADVSPTGVPAPSERLTHPISTTAVEQQKISPTSSSLPWATDRPNTRETEDVSSPPIKRARSAERDPFSLHSLRRDSSPSMRNNNRDMPGTLLGQALDSSQTTMIPKEKSNNFENSIQNQSTGEESCSSDAELSDQGDNDVATPKTEPMGAEFGNMGEHNPFQNGGFLNQNRPSPFPDALLNLGLGLMPPGTSGIPGNPNDYGGRRSLDMMRIRATDPRPCPKCGKIYRSAHTLRTHLEDKHTVCSGYRCVLCGTVAKSRNSLHSHMSRQHRGISTKDLPVLPMPAPFDPDLASRLLAKAGVKITPAELRARASPTGPRRSDIKLDAKSAYSGAPSEAGSSICGENDPEDLTMSRYAGMDFSAAQAQRLHPSNHHQAVAAKTMESYPHLKEPYPAPLHPPNSNANTTGSPLLDTYLQFISENSALAMMNPEHQAQAAAAMQAAKFAQLSAMGMDKATQQQFFEKMQQQMQSANDIMFKRTSEEISRSQNDMVNDRGGTEMDRDPNSSGEEDEYSDDEMGHPHGLKASE